jgi:hypothetical protein
MSIWYNPGALKEELREVIEPLLALDLDIIDLERRFKALYTKFKLAYKFIKQA